MELNEIKGVGPKTLNLLNKLEINTINDLVEYYPYRYEVIKRTSLEEERVIIDGIIESIPQVSFFNKKMNRLMFNFNTGDNLCKVVIFNRMFLKANLKPNTIITVIGKYDKDKNTIIASDIRFGQLPEKPKYEPIYHTINGISSRELNKLVLSALETDFSYNEYIPTYLKDKYKFLPKRESIINIHKPNNSNNLKNSINTLKYEELFLYMFKMNILKLNNKNNLGLKRNITFKTLEEVIDKLPFTLTKDQYSSISEIYDDLTSEKRMNRLLQGDVGSGKTIVAFLTMIINYFSGYQSALMVPTEILAHQHYNSFIKLFDSYNINTEILTGKTSAKDKKDIYRRLKSGEIDIIIGTHALITENVEYKNLGLVITDEQHRFGVNQRSNLRNKGALADVLYMSATPIPRTYALTIYGDMDISNIKTMPSGRKEVITYLKKESEIKEVLTLMYQELKLNHQVYVIAPLIEDSDKIDLTNVNKLEEQMNKAFGKLYTIGVLHGKMKQQEKDEVMNKFKNNDIQILISTTVIEVGIDVPNATTMIIFDAYRFGLSQLHQLRGRVGRNNLQSYCVLISNYEKERLDVLLETTDGFKISEEDFKLRGSGDLFGVRQSGDMIFKIANLKNDYKMLLVAKDDSYECILNKGYLENDYLTKLVNQICNLD
ncbi:MAG: ATP-dependent DNA helicase RecG [Firmicutes bacterium]|nr:ATP-dependent DNA helicase RecG [Bacillota bacterium]